MSEKFQAIVIKSNDRKEKDKNILLFSLEKGKVWATLKGVKGANAKLKIAQNVFCYGEFVVEEGKLGKIVTGFESIETFYELSENVDKYFESMAILEIVNSIEFSNQTEQKNVFVLLLKALKTLCFGNVKPLYVLNKFMLDLFSINGVSLYTEKCSCCGTTAFQKIFIDFNIGEIVCSSCKTFSCQELDKTVYTAIKILSDLSFDKLKTLKLAQDSEDSLLKILVKNFDFRFDKKLKFVGILS